MRRPKSVLSPWLTRTHGRWHEACDPLKDWLCWAWADKAFPCTTRFGIEIQLELSLQWMPDSISFTRSSVEWCQTVEFNDHFFFGRGLAKSPYYTFYYLWRAVCQLGAQPGDEVYMRVWWRVQP